MLLVFNAATMLSQWVLNQLIQEVPSNLGLCEFDCRKVQCTQVKWSACSRRLNGAEGELMPIIDPIQTPAA